jgi:dTDP-4-dehydrorhamnose reductase
MKKLLITGAGGQLGKSFAQLKDHYTSFEWMLADRSMLDVANQAQLSDFFETYRPDACINCAAYTAVDRAETEQAAATLVNTSVPQWLGTACAAREIPLIHYSTDYVYHNGQNRPFRETDATAPKSIYAQTKLAGEEAMLRVYPYATVIRTSWVYAPFGHNFVKTMLRLGKERGHLKVVFDQIGTPTYAGDLARATLEMLAQAFDKKETHQLGGIYNYSNEGVCSWYDFAVAIFEIAGLNCTVQPIESSEFPTPAARPPFSVMNKEKIKKTFGLSIPHWRESLLKCLAEQGLH